MSSSLGFGLVFSFSAPPASRTFNVRWWLVLSIDITISRVVSVLLWFYGKKRSSVVMLMCRSSRSRYFRRGLHNTTRTRGSSRALFRAFLRIAGEQG